MVNILIVSHSHWVAKSMFELMRIMKSSDFEMGWIGGINAGTEFGSNPVKINVKIKELLKTRDVLMVCDLGSTVLNSHKAIEMLPEDLQKRVKVANCPFFEGLLNAITSNQNAVTLEELAEIAEKTVIKK